MLYYERIEKKLDMALDYLHKLSEYAEKKKRYNMKKSVDNVLENIKKI